MADTKISSFSDGTTPAGTDQFVVERSGGNNYLTWTELKAAAPGAEIGYDQITSSVTVASGTEASGTTVITCAAHTFDGSPVIAEFFSPGVYNSAASANVTIYVSLFESSTQIGRLTGTYISAVATGGVSVAQTGKLRFTPTAASHTYTVTAFYSGGTAAGSQVLAGAGGTGVNVPAYIRFTKV